jgi:hypothetical protein
MKKSLLAGLFLGLVFVFVLACGGGGGGDGTSTDPGSATRTYHLYEDGWSEEGFQISFSLSGSTNSGQTVTGTYSVVNRGSTTADGKKAILMESYISMTMSTGTITGIVETYIDAVTHDPIYRVYNDGRTALPTTISERPEMATIGDFGNLTTWAYSDGITETATWLLEDAGNSLANLVMNFIGKDQHGSTVWIEKDTLTIDETGWAHTLKVDFYYPDYDLRIIMSGPRQ